MIQIIGIATTMINGNLLLSKNRRSQFVQGNITTRFIEEVYPIVALRVSQVMYRAYK